MAVEHQLQAIVEKLYSESVQEQGKLLGIGNLLQDLHTHFRMVHGRICGINNSAILMINANDEQHHQLVQKLWSLTLDIDDMLNKVSCYLTKTRVLPIQVHRLFILKRLPFRRLIVRKIEQSIVALQECYAQTYRIRLPARHRDTSAPMACQRAHSIGPEGILGREKEVSDVLRMMQADHGEAGLSVIPITGMAGIGKTALAQLVFSHPWVIKTFGDDRIWVLVSKLPPRLVPIRKMIADACCGVPSLLLSASNKLKSIRKTEVAWQHVLSRFDLVFYKDALLLDATFVSYQQVPSNIQQCFLYCSLFPIHSFTPEQLTEMFVADDLTKLSRSKSDLHMYFSKIMIEHYYIVVQKPRQRENAIYKMHPGIQLLAQRISRGFHSAIDARKELVWPAENAGNARCLSLLVDSKTSKLPTELFEMGNLRTLILLGDENMLLSDNKCSITDIPEEFCKCLTAMRVLHMQSCRIKRVPKAIDMLKKLTYLNLSHSEIETIPDSICNLQLLTHFNLARTEIAEMPESVGKMQTLQVLDLSHCEKLLSLPESISKLVNLQILNLEGCHYLTILPRSMKNLGSLAYLNVLECPLLTQMPCQMNQLTNLKILPRYIAVENHEHTISELCPLAGLKELGICNMENASYGDARNVILHNKHKLESLTLSWTRSCGDHTTSSKAQQILELLKPNCGLKVLCIFSYPAKKLPSWITNMRPYLKSLTEIKLVNLACECLPPLGQLPLLKIVELCGIDAVTCVGDEFYGDDGTFTSLEKLSFIHMHNLEVWLPSEREALFPNLQEITITQCPKFTAVHVKFPVVKSLILLMNNEKLIGSRGALEGFSQNLKYLSVSLYDGLSECSESFVIPPNLDNNSMQKFGNFARMAEEYHLSQILVHI
ncbi:putative disease resistance protein RGA1 [Oryza brachyantha]|uniref:putative disease resistance protein RGA1 n=1 Tax=Oryza brachyantha TaxID=4533 RepID=UPI001AD98C21|nr:putative disease resistance protein RGA1 [Oryza brachyantha]